MDRRAAALALFALSYAAPAVACMCITTADAQFSNAKAVFLARIVSVTKGGVDAVTDVANYRLIQSYKGAPPQAGQIHSSRGWLATSCRGIFLELQEGEYWVFYIDASPEVDRCRGGRQIDPDSADDRQFLESLKARSE